MSVKKLFSGMLPSAVLASSMAFSTALPAAERAYLSHDQAMRGVQKCMKMAQKNKWNMSIVVIDRGEDVVASVRMDGALPASYKGAGLKANTSLSWGMPTGKVNEIMEKVPFFKQFPGILGIPGGAPLFSGDTLIGGVGVAGSSPDNDAKCAAAVATAM